jgi:hypothetical protein
MNLTDITYPLFRLNKEKPEWENDLLVYKNTYLHRDTGNEYTHTKVIDGKVPGDTLSRRRLFLEGKGFALFSPAYAAFFLHDFIKLSGQGHWFIDSAGQLFKHKKSLRCPLIFRKVTRVIPTDSMGSILEIQGIPQRVKSLKSYSNCTGLYAGLLKYMGTYLFYGIYPEKYKDTWRMV